LASAHDVVLIAVDPRTTRALGEPRLARRYHAQMIDLLARDGARVIGYDLEFLGQTIVRDDNALVAALEHHHGVVLAAVRVSPRGDYDALSAPPNVRAVGARNGDAPVPLGPDGSWRRVDYPPRRLPKFDEDV